MTEQIEGKISKIIFRNEENHYTIALLKTPDKQTYTVVGNLYQIGIGDNVKLTGSFYEHPVYGKQFKIGSYEIILPETVDEIEKYLESVLLKGIGHQLAKAIVEKFGQDTFNVLDNRIDELKNIKGIGKKRFEQISNAWNEIKDSREIIFELQKLGLPVNTALKVYQRFGKETLDIIKRNPYSVANEIEGIGFLTADKIAYKLGLSADSQIRIEAAVLYKLNLLANEGHSFYPMHNLVKEVFTMLKLDTELIFDAVYSLEQNGEVYIERGFQDGREYVYSFPLYFTETQIAIKLTEIKNSPRFHIENTDRNELEDIINSQQYELTEEQADALNSAIENKLLVITGGPGTGKTFVIKTLIDYFNLNEIKTSLCAPTGRAAKRLSESTGEAAKTIHRLLEYSPIENRFVINSENPLDTDIVIVDEASMIDQYLFHNLLEALPEHAGLILVGDVDQIPPIGPGNILRDIIDSNVVKTIKLTKIHRQEIGSGIIINAHRINNGHFPEISKHDEAFTLFLSSSENEVLNKIIELCSNTLPENFNYNPFKDIQVISPMYKGKIGIDNLNQKLQEVLNPDSEKIELLGKKFRVGDKVMQTRNNYDKEIFNGDIGMIYSYDRHEQTVMINFEGRLIEYSSIDLDEISLAYAISIHKSQGSEYPVVIIPILKSHSVMLQRNLIYTAVTRGKEKVFLMGDKFAIEKAIRTNRAIKRNTLLKERLRKLESSDY